MNHDAISMQMCFHAGLSAASAETLLDRLSERMRGGDSIRARLAGRDGLIEQHHRDSRELRSLCAARDEARCERDRLRQALQAIADTKTHPGDEKAGLLLASAVNLAHAALTQQEQS